MSELYFALRSASAFLKFCSAVIRRAQMTKRLRGRQWALHQWSPGAGWIARERLAKSCAKRVTLSSLLRPLQLQFPCTILNLLAESWRLFSATNALASKATLFKLSMQFAGFPCAE